MSDKPTKKNRNPTILIGDFMTVTHKEIGRAGRKETRVQKVKASIQMEGLFQNQYLIDTALECIKETYMPSTRKKTIQFKNSQKT